MTNPTGASRPHTPDRTWWKAPLIASVPGLPLLALEYGVLRSHAGMGQYGGGVHTALALFTLAWALPHRRSLRTLRVVAAGAALVVTVLPVALVVMVSA
ncbi:hypothetical protein [Streptomyces sp. NPDC058335]|uniref:hypothetical protein n=1 Tax=Streptomyces sp. NPDC058335 TaxID=3346451 RepID=UPI0036534422